MSEETLFEFEDERTADEAATILRDLADGFDEGTTLTFGDEVAVAVPSTMEVEIEVEREGPADGPAEMEVELELEWLTDAEGAGEVEDDSEGESVDEEAVEEESEEESVEGEQEVASVEDDGDTPDADPVSTPADPPVDEAVPVGAADVASLARFQVYRDRAGEWRWRLVHRNGNIIATGNEGFSSRRNARKGLRSVMTNAPTAAVDVEEGTTD